MKRVIGIGNALTDMLINLDSDATLQRFGLARGSMSLVDRGLQKEISKSVAGLPNTLSLGGSAANTIRAMARLGTSVGFIGKVGLDSTGDFFEQALENLGIAPVIFRGTEPSGRCLALVSPDGERTMVTYLGAALEMKAAEILPEIFKDYDCLYVEGYLVQDHELITRAMHLAKEAGLIVCLDMASYNIVSAEKAFFTQLINKYVDVVFANEQEAEAFTGMKASEAINEIAKLCSIAIVKERKEGTHIRKGTEYIHVNAPDVEEVIDTTGAGDFFAAGFLYGLAMGQSLERCAQIGTLLAGEVIQVVGTELEATTWEKLKLLIQNS